MKPLVSKSKAVATIRQARKISTDIEKRPGFSLDQLDKIASSYSGNSSQYLIGILGGAGGGAVAYVLSLIGASLFFATPICLAAGVAGSILIWRGRNQRDLERGNKEAQTVIDAQLRRIQSLPKGAPQSVIDFEWEEYVRLSRLYQLEPKFNKALPISTGVGLLD